MGCDNIVKVTKTTVDKDADIPFNNLLWTCPINRQNVLTELIARKATVTLTKNEGGYVKDARTCTIKGGDQNNLTCGGYIGDSHVDLTQYHGMRVKSIDEKVGGRRNNKTRKSSRRTRRTRRTRY